MTAIKTNPALQQQMPSQWLTAAEAAAYLRVKPRTLLSWAREGKIKGYTLSGTERITWRFRAADLDAMLLAPAVLPKTGELE